MTTCNVGYELMDTEYFYTVIDEPVKPEILHVYVPKLMPKMSLGSELTYTKGSISKSIFCNDSTCKPSPSSTIKFQNYLTLPHYPNEHPSFPDKPKRPDNPSIMLKHAKFLLSVLHNDVRELYFTGKV